MQSPDFLRILGSVLLGRFFSKSRKIFVSIPTLLSQNQGKVTKQVALWGKYEITATAFQTQLCNLLFSF